MLLAVVDQGDTLLDLRRAVEADLLAGFKAVVPLDSNVIIGFAKPIIRRERTPRRRQHRPDVQAFALPFQAE